jgi:hypothetical protein
VRKWDWWRYFCASWAVGVIREQVGLVELFVHKWD